MPLAINHLLSLGFMAGTTGLEPATSAVTGQRSDQLSYVPRLFFNNLVICHIESESSQFSLLSLCSTISLLWTQIRAFLDTMWTPNWTPKVPVQRQRQVYQIGKEFRRLISAQRQTFIFGCWSQIRTASEEPCRRNASNSPRRIDRSVLLNFNVPGVGQIKLPKWAKTSCQTQLLSRCGKYLGLQRFCHKEPRFRAGKINFRFYLCDVSVPLCT